ncbi:hypothetical protein N431DRAFT_352327 [Stipitochalara longipes BDJ]|nr:hypothetical protein N431DRAFT_352327 [Stipitochalara longipes BDJ]
MDTQSPQSSHFGCFTLQQRTPGNVFLSDVGPDGQLARKRKAHTKSRSGCVGCKTRKCDEEQPCRNCIRRKQECVRTCTAPRKSTSPTASLSHPAKEEAPNITLSPGPELSPMNTEHLVLLHHFEAFTSGTFIMEPEIWKHEIIKLALRNEYLMHAVFLVTATHLKCLQPNEKKYQIIALQNLSQLLPVFRNAISSISDNTEYSTETAESLIACSMLLLQYSWDIDSQVWSDGGSLALYRGLVSITLSCLPKVVGRSFCGMLSWSPRLRIENCMTYAGAKFTPFDGVFAHILTCTKISDLQPENLGDLSDVLQRLSTIFWALDQDPSEFKEFDLELAVGRYLFTLPTVFSDGFIGLLKLQDIRAQIVMIYYLTAISKLKSERFWWMTKRAIYGCNQISRIIGDKCAECTGRAQEILSCKN